MPALRAAAMRAALTEVSWPGRMRRQLAQASQAPPSGPPAIAMAPKAAVIATLYSAIPAIIVAYGYYWLFE